MPCLAPLYCNVHCSLITIFRPFGMGFFPYVPFLGLLASSLVSNVPPTGTGFSLALFTELFPLHLTVQCCTQCTLVIHRNPSPCLSNWRVVSKVFFVTSTTSQDFILSQRNPQLFSRSAFRVAAKQH